MTLHDLMNKLSKLGELTGNADVVVCDLQICTDFENVSGVKDVVLTLQHNEPIITIVVG